MERTAFPNQLIVKTSPQVYINVKNHKYIGLLDPGATRCFISSKLASFLKVRRLPYTGEAISGVGIILRPSHRIVCVLNFEVANQNFEHEFVIVDNPPCKLILGSQFIAEAKIVIDLHEGKFWIKDGSTCKFVNFVNREFLCALQGLTELQNSELDDLIKDFPQVFSDTIGKTDLIKCKLTVDGPPIAQKLILMKCYS